MMEAGFPGVLLLVPVFDNGLGPPYVHHAADPDSATSLLRVAYGLKCGYSAECRGSPPALIALIASFILEWISDLSDLERAMSATLSGSNSTGAFPAPISHGNFQVFYGYPGS